MSATWSDVELLNGSPPTPSESLDEVHVVEGVPLMELSYNGFGALVGWAFGVQAMRRYIDDRVHMTRLITVNDGVTDMTEHPGTPDEQAEVEESINSYLAEAGVPRRLAGHVWYLVLPAGAASPQELWAVMVEQQKTSARPAELLPLFQTVVSRLN